MRGSGRTLVSKWDSKEEDTHHHSGNGNDYIGKSGSYFRDKVPEHARFYPEGNGRNGSRMSAPDDDDLKSREHSGEAWLPRSRVSHDYDTSKSSEQEESRKQYFCQSPSRDRPRTRRSESRSYSRSRSCSRSPLQRVRRDAGGSFKTRARVSPQSGREIDGRYNRAGDYDWEAKNRKTTDTKYYSQDSREQHPARLGGRSDYGSDPILRSHRNESSRDRERRDVSERGYNRSSNVPCRYFASGNCRNANNCRFSHHGAAPPAWESPERKPQDKMLTRHDNNIHISTTEKMQNSHRWNNIERLDTGKSSEVEISHVSSKVMSGAKGGNKGSWLNDMEMSPDWNHEVKTLNEEHSVISKSSQSRVLKDTLAPAYEHGSAARSQLDGNQRSISMFSTMGEKTVPSPHHNLSNNLASAALPVQAFNQNTENHSAVGESQALLSAGTNLPSGVNSSNTENVNAQNTVSKEELKHISNISASLAQFFGNGQPIPHLHSTLYPKQAMQMTEIYGKKELSSHTQTDLLSNNSRGAPAVTALQVNNNNTELVRVPDNLVSLVASSEENRDKKTDEETSKTREEDSAEDAENIVEEEEDDGAGDENKKGKDLRAFKFALVEIIKELLKPTWKEGGMNKDAYKNIVKKVVDKVTSAIQTGNIPQTEEKIDHYLSASKPKLTRLVQAYISKVKKS